MKIALVTGAAKRLGRELAISLGRAGYFVWVHYKESRLEAEATLAEIRRRGGVGKIVSADIASRQQVTSMLTTIKEHSGQLDLLINNVGIYKTGSLIDYAIEDFENTLQTNLFGCFYTIQLSLALFPPSGGNIINIGYAGIENLTSSIHNTAYLISKSGLLILTKSYAEALGPKGIRINMVSPGILANSVEFPSNPKTVVPLGYLGECEDIASTVAFLISEKARYITGINVDVAGGYLLGLNHFEDKK